METTILPQIVNAESSLPKYIILLPFDKKTAIKNNSAI